MSNSSNGNWQLAPVADFHKACGGSSPGPGPSPPAPGPGPKPAGKCVHDQHGPACKSDADCKGVPGCLRCAHSGYCTDVPIGGAEAGNATAAATA